MNKKLPILFFLIFLSLLAIPTLNAKTLSAFATPTPDAKGILYIKKGATGNGSSWSNAYGDFQSAMNSTNAAILQVWIAAGTYSPNYGFSFSIKDGVKIYGGFAGTENDISQRDLKTNITNLQGIRNCVIRTKKLTAATLLDGFTISDGFNQTDSSGNNGRGGGIFNDESFLTISNCIFINNTASAGGGISNTGGFPIITNCTFINNGAAAIYNWSCSATITNCNFDKNISAVAAISNQRSTITVTNCNFTENTGTDGGAMYNEFSNVTVSNCNFLKNNSKRALATINGGGAMYNNFYSNIYIYNCSFIENSAPRYGGAMINNNLTNVTIVNSLFANNTAVTLGNELYSTVDINLKIINTTFVNSGNDAIYFNNDGTMDFTNCIVWAKIESNTLFTAKNSLLLGKTNLANGNIDATGISDTQIFNNPSGGNFSLLEGGIAVNKGNNAVYDSAIFGTLDLSGRPRINETTIDLGAYESKNGTLGVGEFEKSTLITYPNPVKGDFFTIENASVDGNAILYDMSGKEVKSAKIENGKAQVNVSNLSKGMYLLKTTKGKALKILVD